MIEVTGNLFIDFKDANAICLPTNGATSPETGEAIMDTGITKEAAELVKKLPRVLGEILSTQGNRVHVLTRGKVAICSFPIRPIGCMYTWDDDIPNKYKKRFTKGQFVSGEWCSPRLHLIEKSAERLAYIAGKEGWTKVVLPRPGCDVGELPWVKVKEVLEKYLDDRFYILS